MDNRRVFAFLHERLTSGQNAVLVTVVSVDGSSMRNPGTHMGVCEDGSFEGSLSGGCIENAVVAEALDALAEGKPRIVRFGANSPYIDIKLPCGGGLDIHFLPLTEPELIAQAVLAIQDRKPFSLQLNRNSEGARFIGAWQPTGLKDDSSATIGHWPEPKLMIVGHGAVVPALTRLALQMDITVEVMSPDQQLLDKIASSHSIQTRRLSSPSDTQPLEADRWTAITFLFHDHDWEIALMAKAIEQPHFYLGAMGGRRAHAFRRDALRSSGCSDDAISGIHAPIGLFHSSRDPDTLALSTLAQVTQCYHQHDFGDDG